MQNYSNTIFVNCPFDKEYQKIFRAITFCIIDCGFIPRCAIEEDDSSKIRINKIVEIISQCKFGIHDLSRNGLDGATQLARFNMPFELGLFEGAMRFGNKRQHEKSYIIIDSDRFDYQKYISDISGQDIKFHEDDPEKVVRIIRKWLYHYSKDVPGDHAIIERLNSFEVNFESLCKAKKQSQEHLPFIQLHQLMKDWIEACEKNK